MDSVQFWQIVGGSVVAVLIGLAKTKADRQSQEQRDKEQAAGITRPPPSSTADAESLQRRQRAGQLGYRLGRRVRRLMG